MKQLSLIILLLIPFFVPTTAVQAQVYNPADWPTNFNKETNPGWNGTFEFLSKSAYPVTLLAPISAGFVGLAQHNKALQFKSAQMLVGVGVAALSGYTLKQIVKKERPASAALAGVKANDYSFPSGHTTMAFATATNLTLAFPKWYVAAPAYLWASGVGISRTYLGLHYSGDVWMGAILGSASCYLSFKGTEWLKSKQEKARRKRTKAALNR